MAILDTLKGFITGGPPRAPSTSPVRESMPQNLFWDGFWQAGYDAPPTDRDIANTPAIHQSIMNYVRPLQSCPMRFKSIDEYGGLRVRHDAWQSRLLRRPNHYETDSQFWGAVGYELQRYGASLAVIVRDDRNVPVALHRVPANNWAATVEPSTKEIFYSISSSGNPFTFEGIDGMAPSRDVIHFRLNTPRHPLVGESNLAVAALASGLNVAITRSQSTFMQNSRTPSGILSTEGAHLTSEQIQQLRESFNAQSSGSNRGGIPILTQAKWVPLAITSQDAQVQAMSKMSLADISRAMGVPLPLLSEMEGATLTNVHQLMMHFLTTSLGSFMQTIERQIDLALGMDGVTQLVEFDTTALLRLDPLTSAQASRELVTSGLLSLNEARSRLGMDLGSVEGGDENLVQAQMRPVATVGDEPVRLDAKSIIARAMK